MTGLYVHVYICITALSPNHISHKELATQLPPHVQRWQLDSGSCQVCSIMSAVLLYTYIAYNDVLWLLWLYVLWL